MNKRLFTLESIGMRKYYILSYIILSVPIALSFFMRTAYVSENVFVSRLIKVLMLLCFWVLIYQDSLRKSIYGLKLQFDTILVITYTAVGLFSGLIINHQFTVRNVGFPLEFCVIYMGISVFYRSKMYDRERFIKYFLYVFSALFLVHILIAIVKSITYLTGDVESKYSLLKNALKGLFHGSNQFGHICMASVMLSFGGVLHFAERRMNKEIIVFLSLTVISVFALFYSVSRGALLGVAVYTIGTLFLFVKDKKYKIICFNKYVIGIGVLSVIVMFGIFIHKGLLENLMIKIFTNGTTYRTDFWLEFFTNQVNDFPGMNVLFGLGYEPVSVNSVKPIFTLHNLYLEIWGRTGLVSLIIISVLLINLSIKNLNSKRVWFLSFVPIAFLINGIFEAKIIVSNTNTASLFFLFALLMPKLFENEK